MEHTGGFNGWKSVISRSPDDGVGVSVLTNFELGGYNMRIIHNQLYDKLFVLEKIDWESRYVSWRSKHTHEETDLYDSLRYKDMIAPAVPSKRASGLESSMDDHLDFTSYTGAYYHPTYGQLELCDPSVESPKSRSSQCSEAFSQLRKVVQSDFAQTNKIAPDLIAVVANPLFNHLQLRHVPTSSGANFTLSFFEVTHTPKNESQVVILPAGMTGVDFTGEFTFHEEVAMKESKGRPKGFAWGGGVWISGEIGPATGSNFWDRAEVYFERLE